jgi:uncharacterized protein with beta-barrel porin domain
MNVISRSVARFTPRRLLLTLAALALPALAQAQTVSLALNPTSIPARGTTTLTVTLGNTTAAPITLQSAFRLALPPNTTVAGTPSSSCGSGVSAAVGSNALTMATGSNLEPGVCTINLPVTAPGSAQTSFHTFTVPVGALDTSAGPNTAAASVTLEVQASGTVPTVAGRAQAVATAQLTAAGFNVVITTQPSNEVFAGSAIGTNPAAGTSAQRGSTVTLLVSAGPGPSITDSPQINTAGLTRAGQAVAGGLQSTCVAIIEAFNTGTALDSAQQDLLNKCTAIASDSRSMTTADVQQVMNAISGRQANAQLTAPMLFSAGQIANIGQRLADLRNGSAARVSLARLDPGLSGAGQMAFETLKSMGRDWLHDGALGGSAGDDPGGLLDDRLGLFLSGSLNRADHDTTDVTQGFDFRDTSLTAGIDYRIGNSWILGLAAGYGTSRAHFDDDAGRVNSTHYSGALYASYFNDVFHLDVLGGYGQHTNNIGRNIRYASSSVSVGCDGVTCAAQTSGAADARAFNFSIASGLDYHREALAFGPTLEVEYKNVSVDGYTETSDTGLALTYGGISGDSLLAKAGVYASYAWKTRWAVILPQVRARYLHEFRNDAKAQMVNFTADTLAGAATRSFAIFTDEPDRGYIDWKASLLFQFAHGFAAFVDYGGVAGHDNARWNELNVGLRLQTGR